MQAILNKRFSKFTDLGTDLRDSITGCRVGKPIFME